MFAQAHEVTRLSAFAAQIGSGSLPALFALSGAAYLALSLLPQTGVVIALCGNIRIADIWRIAQAAPNGWSPIQFAADWWLMVVAMMTPLAALQVSYVRRSSLPQSRVAAAAAFLAAYWTVWFVTILFLFPLVLTLQSTVGEEADLPVALLLALIYSASPAAQRARNSCHRTGRIEAFGASALAGCARQGLATGASCVAACWPWMLLPLTVQGLHLVPMILVGAYVFADRIAPAVPPAWGLPPAWGTLFGPLWVPRTVEVNPSARCLRARA